MVLDQKFGIIVFEIAVLAIDHLKEFVETFDLAYRDFLEVYIGWATKDLGEEMSLFLIVEEENLLDTVLISIDLSLFIDPFQEETLIRIEIRLLNEYLPKLVYVLCS